MTIILHEVMYQGDSAFYAQASEAHPCVLIERYWWTEFVGTPEIAVTVADAIVKAYQAVGLKTEHVVYDADGELVDEYGDDFDESVDAMELLERQVQDVGASAITSLPVIRRTCYA